MADKTHTTNPIPQNARDILGQTQLDLCDAIAIVEAINALEIAQGGMIKPPVESLLGMLEKN